MKTLFVLFSFASILFSCGTSEVQTAEELSAFVADPENNLSQQAEVNQYKITVTYRPTDLLIHQEIGEDPTSADQIQAIEKRYKDYYYFVLSLSQDGREALTPAQGMETYSELVNVLSFRMHDYVTLTTSAQDTIPVGDFMLNRTYGINTSTDILFVFNKGKSEGKDWVQFNLNEFGLGTGNQRFRFSVGDLQEVPRLKFNLTNG